jgi:hypothetical protein
MDLLFSPAPGFREKIGKSAGDIRESIAIEQKERGAPMARPKVIEGFRRE